MFWDDPADFVCYALPNFILTENFNAESNYQQALQPKMPQKLWIDCQFSYCFSSYLYVFKNP
jgi:hypothetical protein